MRRKAGTMHGQRRRHTHGARMRSCMWGLCPQTVLWVKEDTKTMHADQKHCTSKAKHLLHACAGRLAWLAHRVLGS